LSTNPADLVQMQQPDPVVRQQQQQGVNIMSLLQACFQKQQKPDTTVYLSGSWVAKQTVQSCLTSCVAKAKVCGQKCDGMQHRYCGQPDAVLYISCGVHSHVAGSSNDLCIWSARMLNASTCWMSGMSAVFVYLHAGPVTFCCSDPDDAGWGCGYRNIQMQVSHLLATSPQHRQALFGGAGFVPDIRK
jgi:hypothetical protein